MKARTKRDRGIKKGCAGEERSRKALCLLDSVGTEHGGSLRRVRAIRPCFVALTSDEGKLGKDRLNIHGHNHYKLFSREQVLPRPSAELLSAQFKHGVLLGATNPSRFANHPTLLVAASPRVHDANDAADALGATHTHTAPPAVRHPSTVVFAGVPRLAPSLLGLVASFSQERRLGGASVLTAKRQARGVCLGHRDRSSLRYTMLPCHYMSRAIATLFLTLRKK